jgi:hypothetical protein
MEHRTYTRREVVKGGTAALLGASLTLPKPLEERVRSRGKLEGFTFRGQERTSFSPQERLADGVQ